MVASKMLYNFMMLSTYLLKSFSSFLSLIHITMSSLEEPLGLDKLPSMSTVDKIQRFSSGACRPRVDNLGMGNCFIEGRSCSTSNSCRLIKFYNLLQVRNLNTIYCIIIQSRWDFILTMQYITF